MKVTRLSKKSRPVESGAYVLHVSLASEVQSSLMRSKSAPGEFKMSTLTIVAIAIAILAIIFAVFMYVQKERTQRLRKHFGPEYDRLASESGGRRAEQELLSRQKRLDRFHIRELDQAELDRFSTSWQSVQNEFVDDPRHAVSQADGVIRDVMETRGYPMSDFDQLAADLSVDHPVVVQEYRLAHDIAMRDADGKASTEDLRQAMVHYRALFEELLNKRSKLHLHEVTR
jgi:FtsZ-interacting cell division protein ZipA